MKKYIKCNIWRVAVRPSYIYDARFLKANLQASLNLCEDERLASEYANFTSKMHRMERCVVSTKCRKEKPVAKLRTGLSALQALSGSSPYVHLHYLMHVVWSKHIRKLLLFAVLLIKGSRRPWNKTNNISVLRLEDLLWCGGSPGQISTRREAIIIARVQRHTNTKVRYFTQTKQKQIR
jgi:hypothetical protein